MDRFPLLLLPVWPALCAVAAGCSSVPDFKPSTPIEEASSWREGLDLCVAYQIDGPKTAAGAAKPARAVTLSPWLRCFETVLRRFPEARASEDMVAFFRDLQKVHDVAQPSAEVIDWPAMNYVVRRIVAHLSADGMEYSREEREAINRQLPGYGLNLAEANRYSVLVRLPSAGKPEGVAGGAAGASPEVSLPPRPLPLSNEQREYCKDYRAFVSQGFNLEELKSYERALEDSTHEDVGNSGEEAARGRIAARVAEVEKNARERRLDLDGRLRAMQAKSAWFREGYCLQEPSRFR